ncbi:hypothetical protein LXA43DRAFT_1033721 [Ganoderma leucocontextum]|nr:hypothetical protein LXA43DRAFT_1033721 [Ganoderma leucocontextum]
MLPGDSPTLGTWWDTVVPSGLKARTDDVEYSPVPESDRHKADPALTSPPRRIWRRFKTSNWCTDLGAIAMALSFLALGVCMCIMCYFLNLFSTYIGGRILHYTIPIWFYSEQDSNGMAVTAPYAHVAFVGSAIVNVVLMPLMCGLTILAVESGHGPIAAGLAWWGTLFLGMVVGSASAASLGIVVVPPERAPEGLSAIHALAAGSLGMAVIESVPLSLGALCLFGPWSPL